MIKKIAIFEDSDLGFQFVGTAASDTVPNNTRLTEWVTVDFTPLPPAELVPQQVAAIDKQIAGITAQCEAQLAGLNERKAELLALPCPS